MAATASTLSLAEEAVHTLQVSNAAIEKAAGELAEVRKGRDDALTFAPSIADMLVKMSYVHPTERDAAIQAVGDHQKLARMLQGVLQHSNCVPGPLAVGKEVPNEKSASRTRSPQVSAADAAYRAALDSN